MNDERLASERKAVVRLIAPLKIKSGRSMLREQAGANVFENGA